eukprot:scaffold77691_cov30-Tisochrysis_lutea.AAC.9
MPTRAPSAKWQASSFADLAGSRVTVTSTEDPAQTERVEAASASAAALSSRRKQRRRAAGPSGLDAPVVIVTALSARQSDGKRKLAGEAAEAADGTERRPVRAVDRLTSLI